MATNEELEKFWSDIYPPPQVLRKYIYITNGMARSGKDTFAKFLNEFIPTYKYSSVNRVKDIARLCGWEGGKTEKDRKFLSDLKVLTTEYSNMPFESIREKINRFRSNNDYQVMLIDIREPKEIEKAKVEFNAKTIFIVNNNVENISSNMADAGVFNYEYDYYIDNNGTLEEFRNKVKQFVDEVINA